MFTLGWHLGIPDGTMSYSLLICPRTDNTFVFMSHWMKILGTGGQDDHSSHTVILLRLWNSGKCPTFLLGEAGPWWWRNMSWTGREAKQKSVLPESGKWGLFLLLALSRQFNDPNGKRLIHSWGRKQDSILLCRGKSTPTNPFALSILQTAKQTQGYAL